jgi:hypothetical protein
MTKEIIEQGARYLAVSVGESTKGTALTRILALKSSPGWSIEGAVLREWRFSGMTERGAAVYLYGPHVVGRTLGEVLSLPLAQALPFLATLAHALVLLTERAVPWFPLQTDSILFPDQGGILFLPPAVFQELRDLRPFAENLESYECLAHPDLKGEARASFTVACLLYRIITGRFPFTGKDGEEVHEQARKLAITPPDQVVPELIPEVSELVMAGLTRGRRPQPKLEEWAACLDAWQQRQVFRTMGAEAKAKVLRDMEAQQAGSARSFQRRMFWEKNWKIVGIIAAVVIVVGAIGGSMLKNILAPRVTKGYSAQKVVETFYTSMNALDHMTMQACVIGKAGQGELNETTTLYVTSRVVMGYEGSSNIVSAAVWDAAGRPVLVSPQSLYGVTALTITQEQGEPTPVFLVSYDKWNPLGSPDTGQAPDMNAVPLSEGHATKDRVFMKQDKGDWVIYKIDRLQADPLPAPKAVQAPPKGTGGTLGIGGTAAPQGTK